MKSDPTQSGKSEHASCAATVKAELIAAFPGIKFSAKSDSFSGGDSVHINWTDGPTTEEVETISGKYQYGHFDGMTDMYEYSNKVEGLPQAKFVSEHREMSAQVNNLLPQLIVLMEGYEQTDYRNQPEQVLYRLFRKTSLLSNAKILGIERTDTMGGSVEDFFYIKLDLPEQTAAKPAPIETKEGEIKIIDYSEKAIAIVGDTKRIKDQLKELGGKFNFRLSCGAGWIFPKSKLAEIIEALSKKEKVKEELIEEIQKTVEFFKESDVRIYGEVQEQTKEIERIQKPFEVKKYNTLAEIEHAANSGEQISLCNLFDLVQTDKRKQA